MFECGTRFHPCKEDCLILDYGDNVLRHGPVDMIKVEDKPQGNGKPPAKECPTCLSLIHAAYMTYPDCGHVFPARERETHDEHATTEGILSGEITDNEYEVIDVNYAVHIERGADEFTPKTMRVEYQVGWKQWISEWVCPEHTGWARHKFEKWWSERSSYPPPETAQDAVALANDGVLSETKAITVRSIAGERFYRVIRYESALSQITPPNRAGTISLTKTAFYRAMTGRTYAS